MSTSSSSAQDDSGSSSSQEVATANASMAAYLAQKQTDIGEVMAAFEGEDGGVWMEEEGKKNAKMISAVPNDIKHILN